MTPTATPATMIPATQVMPGTVVNLRGADWIALESYTDSIATAIVWRPVDRPAERPTTIYYGQDEEFTLVRAVCWCDAAATYLAPASCASTGGPRCEEHATDGSARLAPADPAPQATEAAGPACPVVYPFGTRSESLCPACWTTVDRHYGAERAELVTNAAALHAASVAAALAALAPIHV